MNENYMGLLGIAKKRLGIIKKMNENYMGLLGIAK